MKKYTLVRSTTRYNLPISDFSGWMPRVVNIPKLESREIWLTPISIPFGTITDIAGPSLNLGDSGDVKCWSFVDLKDVGELPGEGVRTTMPGGRGFSLSKVNNLAFKEVT